MTAERVEPRPDRGNRPLIAVVALVCLLLILPGLAVLGGLVDPQSLIFTNRDHANAWLASKLLLSGEAGDLFREQEVYFAHMRAAFGPDFPWHNWSYPPHYLLLVAPLALLPYFPSALLFLLATVMLYGHAASQQKDRFALFSALLLLPFIATNALAVQNGFLTAALLLCGLGLRQRRPLLAGIAIGLLTVKPQLGLLLPVLLIVERNWRAFASAAVTTLVMVAASLPLVGIAGWQGYVVNNLPYQMEVMNHLNGAFPHLMPSVFGSLRSLGQEAETARLFHLPVAAVAGAVFVWSLVALKTAASRARSLVYATFLISPYSLNYDLGALVALAALAARPDPRLPPGLAQARLLLSCMVTLLPVGIFVLGLKGMPVTPLILAAAYGVTLASDRLIEKADAGTKA